MNLPVLGQVMDRAPIMVPPDTVLLDAISRMSQSPEYCHEGMHRDRSMHLNPQGETAKGSVLVMEEGQVVGILTEQDILRLTASGVDLSTVKVAEVMTQPVITLTSSSQQDILTAWSLMRQQNIRYLPILNKQGQVIGLISQSDFFRCLDPVTLFQSTGDRRMLQYDNEEGTRQQTAEKLQEMSAALSNAVEGISRLDTQGRYLEVNRAYANMVGYQPEEMIGMAWQATVHPDDIESMMAAYQHMLDHGRVEVEARGVRKDGSIFYKQLTMVTAYKQQQLTGHYCFMKDVSERARHETERKQMEAALRESEQRLQSILDNSTAVIFVKDTQGRYIMINHRYQALFKIDKNEIKGKTDYDIFPKEIADVFQTNDRKVMAAGVALESEELAPQDDGLHTYLSIKFPLFDQGGKIYAVCGMSTDITDRKAFEVELQQQKQELARSNAELQQFAYVASHDLQEPLRMITSYLELLERRYKGQLDAKADQFITYAMDGAVRMQTLIHDLLNYSRVGTRGTSFEQVDCAIIVKNALRNLQVAIAESKAKITHGPLPHLTADAVQLTQLFQNLISNAIKFRREDPPQIQIKVKQLNGEWLFSVQDNGIGIEAEYTERIFVIFQRLHSRMDYPGTGMGLAICKKIVERHGGNLWVESKPNEGSTFYFTLPEAEGTQP